MKTFAGIPEEFHEIDNASIVLTPVPYDGTSTWIKGSDKGPEAFLNAAENMELYDIETNSEVYRRGIHLDEAVSENSSPESMTEAVYNRVNTWLDKEKFVTLFGGEHSISIGSLRAYAERFDDLTVLQIDAHADLRPEYEGSACNHACAVYEASKKTNLIQVGIRSMDVSEKEHMNRNKVIFGHEITADSNAWMNSVLDMCTDNVYITIDLDGFDPSVLPSTGTPEPGGLSWYQMTELCKRVIMNNNLVGFDIVELCPNPNEKSSDFVAAKLYYKLLSYKFESK